jgi:hypothetical protein
MLKMCFCLESKVVKNDMTCHFYIDYHINVSLDASICQINLDVDQTFHNKKKIFFHYASLIINY